MKALRKSVQAPPLVWTWEGDAMKPLPRFQRLCDRDFVIGEQYRMETVEERSHKSHAHYFACINEAWKNMPEGLAEQFPSPDHLRKRALVEAGFYHEEVIDCDTNEAALRVAATFRRREEFSLVIVREQYVVIRTPMSQSVRAMGKEQFQKSKEAVLAIVSEMVGVEAKQLGTEAGQAA